MARAFGCLVALGYSTLLLAQAPARDRPPAAGTASIHGRVLDAGGRPLSRVEVRAGTGTGPAGTVLTDGNGRYDLTDLPAGTYAVSASKPNYVRASWGEQRPEGPGKRIALADGQRLDNIDIRLARTGAVTGRIFDEFGDPVTDVSVSAMRYQHVQGTRRLMPGGRGGQTNDLGEFRVYGLPPGQYYLSATLRNVQMNGGAMDNADRNGYAPTFYPGTGNVAEAQRLAIAPGQAISGINLSLLPIQTSTISGTVIDTDGRPLVAGMISLTAKSLPIPINMGAPVRGEGQFTVNGLPPGEYVIRAMANGGGGDASASTEVTVTGGDITGLQLALARPSTVRGRIVFTPPANGADPPKPAAINLGALREWMLGQPVRHGAKVKDDGTFEILLPAGHVQLRAAPVGAGGPNAPPPWRLARVVWNDVDVGDLGIDVPANATIDNVVVEMTNRQSELTGTVKDADGTIVRDVFVILFAQDQIRWTVQGRYLGVGRPGLDDRYRVRLLPGDYYAVAMRDVEPGAWTDPEFLSLAREHATRVSIADGDSKALDLLVSPAPVF